jgi:hypothetical protein
MAFFLSASGGRYENLLEFTKERERRPRKERKKNMFKKGLKKKERKE